MVPFPQGLASKEFWELSILSSMEMRKICKKRPWAVWMHGSQLQHLFLQEIQEYFINNLKSLKKRQCKFTCPQTGTSGPTRNFMLNVYLLKILKISASEIGIFSCPSYFRNNSCYLSTNRDDNGHLSRRR